MTTLDYLEKLLAFDTTSAHPNADLIAWVQAQLVAMGANVQIIENAEGSKANLFATIGPGDRGGVMLSGHTDVVPVDGQPWADDPFTVVERDGKYFGRGTCDMKGFDALAIWTLVEAHHRGVKRPLQLALSYDEEVGCTGAPPMIDRMGEVLPKASAVIVGEPSMMKAVTGHKGGQGFMTHVVGFEVHSSIMHTGVNAIMFGAKLIDWANQVNAESMARTPGPLAAMFDPPWTTAHVGTIQGGTAHNITAKDCRFGMDFRAVPGENLADWRDRYLTRVREVEAEMQAIHPAARIDISEKFVVPGLQPEEEGEAETLVRAITGDNGGHVVSYGTEAGQFQERGYSAVICGPGDIAQAHQPDEYITKAQFDAGHDFMRRLLDRL